MKTLFQCDFDGTITPEDVSFMILDAFGNRDWRKLLEQYREGKITVAQFNGRAVRTIKADEPTLVRFVRDRAKLRPGLRALLDYCHRRGFRFVVVSNGLDFYIKTILGDIGAGDIEGFAAETSFGSDRVRVRYLDRLGENSRRDLLDQLFDSRTDLVVIGDRQAIPDDLKRRSEASSTPLLSSAQPTVQLVNYLQYYLTNLYAEKIILHGVFMEVFSLGLLLTGDPSVGKSELALELVARGHRLVADDVVIVSRRPPALLVGSSNELLGHRMEIRGLGIIDIEKLFGIRAIRLQKRVEVEVCLVYWEDQDHYERLGLEDKFTEILGVEIPIVTIPISPGKNITVISEVIAMNHMLRVFGTNPAPRFNFNSMQFTIKYKDVFIIPEGHIVINPYFSPLKSTPRMYNN